MSFFTSPLEGEVGLAPLREPGEGLFAEVPLTRLGEGAESDLSLKGRGGAFWSVE